MVAFMRGLSNQVVGEKGIRVNGQCLSVCVGTKLILCRSGRAWADLDAAHPGDDDRGLYQEVRNVGADGESRPARRSRYLLRIPGQRGLELHQRPGHPC
jgi:hypothetical protein